MSLSEIRKEIERKKGQKQQVEADLDKLNNKLSELEQLIIDSEQAQIIIQTVAKETQKELQFHISDIVTLALSTIFDKPYSFEVNFVISCLSKIIVPDVGASSLKINLKIVVFPAPDGPVIKIKSPSATSNETSLIALISPKLLETFLNLSILA